MRRAVLIMLWLAACKDRGTINVPILEPCVDQASEVAVYLKAGSCDATCGLSGFQCIAPDCVAGCDGYCSPDELEGLEIEAPRGGEKYALIFSYRYASTGLDAGLVCFSVQVDADGTQSMNIANEVKQNVCCAM
jgi:hypothetical protein